MSTEGRKSQKVNPRLFSGGNGTSGVYPQSQRQRAPRRKNGEQTYRKALHLLQKQSEPQSEESREFYSPEYLDYQSRSLKLDIENIEKELKPLKIQYEQLKQQEDNFVPNSPRSPKSNAGDYSSERTPARMDFSSILKQGQLELKEAQNEIAILRRVYSESNKSKLEEEIEEYQEQIEQYVSSLDASKEKLEKVTSDLETIRSSEDAEIIINQRKQIEELEKELIQLENIEDEYMKKNDEMMDQAPQIIGLSNKVNSLKKKLASLKYKKSSLIVEMGKKRRFYEQRKIALQDIIQDTKNKKRRAQEQQRILDEMSARLRGEPVAYAQQNEYEYEYSYSYSEDENDNANEN